MLRDLIFMIFLLFLAGCAGAKEIPTPAGDALPDLGLKSPAFTQGAAIPSLYSCKGEDKSPALEWQAPPAGTQSLALVMDDPDAPVGTWVHWVVYNLSADTLSLPEGTSVAKGKASLPAGTLQGKNSWGRQDYGGPCPPSGTHRYFFRLYALDTTLPAASLDKTGLLKAIAGHILAQGEMMGTFSK
jgi:Raf kinase inhibitor-like YbhB/YbcL family protein